MLVVKMPPPLLPFSPVLLLDPSETWKILITVRGISSPWYPMITTVTQRKSRFLAFVSVNSWVTTGPRRGVSCPSGGSNQTSSVSCFPPFWRLFLLVLWFVCPLACLSACLLSSCLPSCLSSWGRGDGSKPFYASLCSKENASPHLLLLESCRSRNFKVAIGDNPPSP